MLASLFVITVLMMMSSLLVMMRRSVMMSRSLMVMFGRSMFRRLCHRTFSSVIFAAGQCLKRHYKTSIERLRCGKSSCGTRELHYDEIATQMVGRSPARPG